MKQDIVDMAIEQWTRERPDLDASSLSVVSRSLIAAQKVERSADRALAQFGLTLWQLDVLAALRRSGAPYRLSPTQLMRQVFLSSGAMTNRLDRLETMGLIERTRDAKDRRGVLISLTPKGRKLVDEAIAARFENAREIASVFSKAEARTLANLLRKLVVQLMEGDCNGDPSRARSVSD